MTSLIEKQPVSEVISWPERPRHNPANGERLRESLQEHGVEHPITVVSRDDYLQRLPRQTNAVPRRFSYVAISEYHWLEAARSLGLLQVPVLVRPMPQDSVAAFVLRRHLHDDHLGPLDEARLLDAAFRAPGQTLGQNAFAKAMRMSRATLSQRLGLLKLTPEEQVDLEAGRLTIKEARERVGTSRGRGTSTV